MDNKQATLELGTKPVSRLLMQYALPAIVAMVAASLYNMVDSIFIGQGVGALAIAGLAITFPFMNLSAAFGAAVGVGSCTFISMKLGQRDYAIANKILGNCMMLNIVVGVCFGGICLLFLDPILRFFGASDNTLPYAKDYMQIILLGNVFTHLYKDQLQLGCFTQKGFSASGRDTIYYIDLYDNGNKLEPLANEKVEGPSMNKEWWTPDKVANFTEVAEKFGFLQSRQHWEKVPNDPVFASGMNDSCNHRFDFLLTNNHGKGFYNALLATQKGDAVEGFRVHGKLYFR